MRRFLPTLSSAAAVFAAMLTLNGLAQPAAPISSNPDNPATAAAILQELQSFREMGSVLLVAAHPDDEDSNLIAFLARGRHLRTAYLSMTRGDGGQNLLGPEIGDELGVIRTQELLAARRVDGAQQFFTRARDFGYSKDYRETFRFWGEKDVLSDVVRVIRTFRPDVVVAVFSTNSSPGQHGHHTGSAILAGEAFKLAGDPTAFPEQLDKLKVWQPKRLLQDRGRDLVMQIGEGYGVIAAKSRSMHKTQGFGNTTAWGAGTAGFTFLNGERATNDLLDGVDTTWNCIPGGKEIGTMADDVIAHFDPTNVEASVPELLKIHHLLTSLPLDSLLDEKQNQLVLILQTCLGIFAGDALPGTGVIPGDKFTVEHQIEVRGKIPVTWLGVHYPGVDGDPGQKHAFQGIGQFSIKETRVVPINAPITQPYWLREEGSVGLFRVDDVSLIGRAENPPYFTFEDQFEVMGERFSIPGSSSPFLVVIPPVSLNFLDNVTLFPPGKARKATVEITAVRENTTGTLRLEAPTGWQVQPSTQNFSIGKAGETNRFTFTITAPANKTTAEILAVAKVGGVDWHTHQVVIWYSNLPPQMLQSPARLKAVSLDLAVSAHKIGYIPGAGDDIAAALTRMGCEVTQLEGKDLTAQKLSGLDAVVVGIRAFNVRTDLAANMQGLFDFATNGGSVIVLYNRPQGRATVMHLAPYSLSVSGDRVTDETAEMTLLVPESPVFNTPNKIVPEDFDGWVQERGAYYADQWDPHFTPLISAHDPGEQPLRGGLLVAQYGKGYFVYTALSWFRQLPDGVPGAYRLFANLVSLGK
jgi:LmbE family N-acetylglucosaminyl deacetylase